MTQIITPASSPLLCHCPLAKPKEISSLLCISRIWGFHQPVEVEVMTSQQPMGTCSRAMSQTNEQPQLSNAPDKLVQISKLIFPVVTHAPCMALLGLLSGVFGTPWTWPGAPPLSSCVALDMSVHSCITKSLPE